MARPKRKFDPHFQMLWWPAVQFVVCLPGVLYREGEGHHRLHGRFTRGPAATASCAKHWFVPHCIGLWQHPRVSERVLKGSLGDCLGSPLQGVKVPLNMGQTNNLLNGSLEEIKKPFIILFKKLSLSRLLVCPTFNGTLSLHQGLPMGSRRGPRSPPWKSLGWCQSLTKRGADL